MILVHVLGVIALRLAFLLMEWPFLPPERKSLNRHRLPLQIAAFVVVAALTWLAWWMSA